MLVVSGMFNGATALNADMSIWNVSRVNYKGHMMTSFNQNMSNLDTSSVDGMNAMFYGWGEYAYFTEPTYTCSRNIMMCVLFEYPLSSFNMKLYLKPTWVGDIDFLIKKLCGFIGRFFIFKIPGTLKFPDKTHSNTSDPTRAFLFCVTLLVTP